MKVQVDTFNETMFDDTPIQVMTHDKTDWAEVFIPGQWVTHIRFTIPKVDAFNLLKNVCVMTYNEVREHLIQLESYQ